MSSRFAGFLLVFCLSVVPAHSGEMRLLGEFQKGWWNDWTERAFTGRRTRYTVVREGETRFLRGESDRSASGYWRVVDIQAVPSGTISWKWKLERGIPDNHAERTRKGDDYAARVFVVFKPHFLNWRTPSLCYVWASHEPSGSMFASPYSENVGMFVLQSGDGSAGRWIDESRDFVADYKQFFGEAPEVVSAVAFMVDTDNTGARARSAFTDIVLTIP